MSLPGDLVERVMRLDARERAALGHFLLESAEPESPVSAEDWQAFWADEIDRRSGDVADRRVVLVPWEVVRERLGRETDEPADHP
jgi:hypothetical protein